MKPTLFIQTALPETQVALISDDHFEVKTFPADKTQSQQLFQSISSLTSQISPQQILVISGPGAFTGLRVGITSANAISHALQIPQAKLTTFDFLRAQYSKDFPVALPGGNIILWQSKPEAEIQHLNSDQFQSQIQAHSQIISSNLLGTQIPSSKILLPQPITKSLLQNLLNSKKLTWQNSSLTPDYFREPHITPSKS